MSRTPISPQPRATSTRPRNPNPRMAVTPASHPPSPPPSLTHAPADAPADAPSPSLLDLNLPPPPEGPQKPPKPNTRGKKANPKPSNPNPPENPQNPNPPENPQNPNPSENPQNPNQTLAQGLKTRRRRVKIVASELPVLELSEEEEARLAMKGVRKVWDAFGFKPIPSDTRIPLDGYSLCELQEALVGKVPSENIYATPPWHLTRNRRFNTTKQSWVFPSQRALKGLSTARQIAGSDAYWKNKFKMFGVSGKFEGEVGILFKLELHRVDDKTGGGCEWFAWEFISNGNKDGNMSVVVLTCTNESWVKLEMDVEAAEQKLRAAADKLVEGGDAAEHTQSCFGFHC